MLIYLAPAYGPKGLPVALLLNLMSLGLHSQVGIETYL